MFYDLNVPWTTNVAELTQTITFLHELGYNVIALSHTISGKLPGDLSSPIPSVLPCAIPKGLTILRRCTLIMSDPSQNHRLASLASNYDILALRPTNEKSLQQACQAAECDIISFDLTVRLDFHFKMKMLAQGVTRGVKFEICYGPGILSPDLHARRNSISNATQLIRASRGRGIILSSEAWRASGCRGPQDVINLAAIWGLGQERGLEAISKWARNVTVSAKMKRTSYRGVVDIVKGNNDVDEEPAIDAQKDAAAIRVSAARGGGSGKRKADQLGPETNVPARPISKREQKRQKKAASIRNNSSQMTSKN